MYCNDRVAIVWMVWRQFCIVNIGLKHDFYLYYFFLIAESVQQQRLYTNTD